MTERFEWSSLARLADSYAHEWSWAQQCASRVRPLVFYRADVTVAYLRVWHGDVMFGCPVVQMSDGVRRRRFNVPRSSPTRLAGDGAAPEAAEVLAAAFPEVQLYDDSAELAELAAIASRLRRRSDRDDRSWSLTAGLATTINSIVKWDSADERELWLDQLDQTWRGAWKLSAVTHQRNAKTIGVVFEVHRHGWDPEVITAVRAKHPAPPWLSQRVPQ